MKACIRPCRGVSKAISSVSTGLASLIENNADKTLPERIYISGLVVR